MEEGVCVCVCVWGWGVGVERVTETPTVLGI